MKNKIAFISEHASPLATLGGVDSGGQNVYVAELAKHLLQKGYEIDIFTRWESKDLPQVIQWIPGIRVIHAEAGPVTCLPKEELFQYMPQFTQSMINFIRDENLDYQLIHANFWMSGFVASQLKTFLNIPFVITFHALGHVRKLHQKEDDKFPENRIQVEREIAQYADQVIAECPQDQDDLVNHYGVPADKISIVPCGFSKTEFYPVDKAKARKILNLDANEHLVLQLGRMVPRKGIDNVIRAIAKLNHDSKNVRLIIVGGESDLPDASNCPELARLQNIVAKENISCQVTFTGRKDRNLLKYFYSAADIFITTPWYEPFGITPLEAMACGTPVIGADVGGIKYSVVHNETGFLVPPNNPGALAEKIDFLFANPVVLDQMKINALKRVNEEFTWSRVASMISELYTAIRCSREIDMNNESRAA